MAAEQEMVVATDAEIEATEEQDGEQEQQEEDDTMMNGEEVVLEAPATPELEAPTTVVLEELEKDEPLTKAPTSDLVVSFSSHDKTLDAFFSGEGTISKVSALSEGAFRQLLSGVRSTVGAKSGRYLFEVKVLERFTKVAALRVGLSTDGSSLLIGEHAPESVCFDSDGNFISTAEPKGKATCVKRACRSFGKRTVGLLLNFNEGTVSVFLDGKRAGVPQRLPAHLAGKVLFPTITYRNTVVAVNFGASGTQLKALPFTVRCFGDIAKDDAVASNNVAPKARQVALPVGLPDAGVLEFADRFLEDHPEFMELSDRMMHDWCVKSGLTPQGTKRDSQQSHDRPHFDFGVPALESGAWRPLLQNFALLSSRSLLVLELRSNFLKEERAAFLKSLPTGVEKRALVAVGEPNSAHKDWVQKRSSTSSDDLPDVSEQALGSNYAKFTFPSSDEGFDNVSYEWASQDAAKDVLAKWMVQRKTTQIVEGLEPSEWFTGKLKDWHTLRETLRNKHKEYSATKRKAQETGDDEFDDDALDRIKLPDTEDIHDADGKGSPIYGHFKYEDWLLLSFRIELHLLVVAFLHDVADPDRTGIPEAHVEHYFKLYFKSKLDVGKVGVDSLAKAVKILQEPLELQEGHCKELRSKLPVETSLEDLVKAVEKYRRNRQCRVDAGDESALLTFPKPQKPAPGAKAPAKAATPAKAKTPATAPVKAAQRPSAKGAPQAPQASRADGAVPAPFGKAAKRPAPVEADDEEEPEAKKPRADGGVPAPFGKAAVAKAPVAKAPVAKAPIAKAPVAKAPVTKAPAVAKAPVSKAPAAKAPIAKRKAAPEE